MTSVQRYEDWTLNLWIINLPTFNVSDVFATEYFCRHVALLNAYTRAVTFEHRLDKIEYSSFKYTLRSIRKRQTKLAKFSRYSLKPRLEMTCSTAVSLVRDRCRLKIVLARTFRDLRRNHRDQKEYNLETVMCAKDSMVPANYFPDIGGNLTKIVWAHAVNSTAKLDTALASDVMMIEGDIVLGKWNSSDNTNINETIPIMAHPPENVSDLSLEKFLSTVIEKKTKKGIKLDFKSTQAFSTSKPILDKVLKDIQFPVFLNADIIRGPVNATAPVDANTFLSLAKTYPDFTLSVGWTTRYGSKDNVTKDMYTDNHIQEMLNKLKEQKITQPITYPVRAGLAANSISVIKSLMTKSSDMKDATLTVWSSEGDEVNAEQLSTLIKDIGVTKVYLDVPQELMKNLRLSGASSFTATSITLVMSLVTVALSTIL